jgi:hypothetical protein
VSLFSDDQSVAGRNTDRFTLRLPADGMHERIAKQARLNHRTMNAEIIAQLQGAEFLRQELDRLRRLVDALFGSNAFPEMTNGQE